jgi:23S rRNA (cytidine1920-2'-O)/16S rRNA (cytidine1409-2'-O)-methyltransferase
MMKMKRADMVLQERGFFESRAKARAALEAGLVRINGSIVTKPATPVAGTAQIVASAPHPWVSRGGVKLDHALAHFAVDPSGRYCLDVGASTGGFTDVLLARNARHVIAVDVGRDQLHPKLRVDPRVTSLEGQDIRTLAPARLAEPPSLVVVDASFIALTSLLASIASLAAGEAELVALIKPQFEAGRGATKKGVVRDEKIHSEVCARVVDALSAGGWRVSDVIASPISGGDGNREFLLHAARG